MFWHASFQKVEPISLPSECGLHLETQFWQTEYNANDGGWLDGHVIKGTAISSSSSIFSSFLPSSAPLHHLLWEKCPWGHSRNFMERPTEQGTEASCQEPRTWAWKQIFQPLSSLRWRQPCEGPWARITQLSCSQISDHRNWEIQNACCFKPLFYYIGIDD